MWTKLVAFAGMLLFAAAASAAPQKPSFSDAYLYPAPGKVGMGFFTVISPKDDTIIASSSDCCSSVEIHRTEKINGVMTMRRVQGLRITEDKPVAAQPNTKGGLHLMLIGLKSPLEEDDSIDVTFTFERAGAETVRFVVKPRPEQATSDHSAHAHE